MGSYYAGMMNATGGSYLRHFGILGMKWGIRRWQNEDGSLTPEGRVHYGVGPMSKKAITNDLNTFAKLQDNVNSIYKNFKSTPNAGIKAAAINKKMQVVQKEIKNSPEYMRLKSQLKEYHDDYESKENSMYDEMQKFYDNEKLYEKYLDKVVKKRLKDYPDDADEFGGDLEKYKDLWRYDDFDQGDYDTFEHFISEQKDHPIAVKYKNAKRIADESEAAFSKQIKDSVKELCGDNVKACNNLYSMLRWDKYEGDNNQPITGLRSNKNMVKDRLTPKSKLNGQLTETGKNMYGDDISKQKPEKVRKQVERSELFGDNDGVYKAAEKYRRAFNKKKDPYSYNSNWKKEALEYMREAAAERLKSMGYKVNEKNISWLVGQDWFKPPFYKMAYPERSGQSKIYMHDKLTWEYDR